ncbi:MAG: translocation/assembly module TamB domain-containing protein [Zymomonas mobilis subsp. pomaceae]|uniref:translocation/assembly module TamB domain-containing protein n=1 Tax=Zymomonas mobilis TaxID=542 RepID=UPI0039EAC9ED
MEKRTDIPPSTDKTESAASLDGDKNGFSKNSGHKKLIRLSGWLKLAAFLLAIMLFIPSVLIFFIDSSLGHQLLIKELRRQHLPNGLHFSASSLEGSIWHKMVIHNLRFYDLDGIFLEIPQVNLDWHLWSLWNHHWDIRLLQANAAHLYHLPHLRTQGKPFRLPNNYIRIDNFAILHLEVDRPPSKNSQDRKNPLPIVTIKGKALTTKGQLTTNFSILSTLADDVRFLIDINPAHNQFSMKAAVTAPAKGVIAQLGEFDKGITADLGGQGQWQSWQGHLRAFFDKTALANIQLTKNMGDWHIEGIAHPALMTGKNTARLLGSESYINAHIHQKNRLFEGNLKFLSPTLQIEAKGGMDFDKRLYNSVVVETQLKQAEALDAKMRGEHIILTNHLEGSFDKAHLAYQLKAHWLSFGKERYEDATLAGDMNLSQGFSAIPLKLTIRHIAETDRTTEDLTRDLELNGLFDIRNSHLISDKVTLTSHFLQGHATLDINLKDGAYKAHILSDIHRYPIPHFALLNIKGDIQVDHPANAPGVKATGHLAASTENFENNFLRGLMEGTPILDTDFIRQIEGTTYFSKMILRSPALQLAMKGERENTAGNPLHLVGQGHHRSYGPLITLKLDGDIAHPEVALLLDHPVDSLGLKTVTLNLQPTASGYDWQSHGGSTLGNFSGKGRIEIPPNPSQPTIINVQGLEVSESRLTGNLTAVGHGVNGQLLSTGALTGKIDFQVPVVATADNQQQIRVNLASDHGHLGGVVEASIRHGMINADIQLGQNSAIINGNVSGEEIKGKLLEIGQLKGDFHLNRDNGFLHIIAQGNHGQPFTLDSTAHLKGDQITIEGQGSIAHIGLQLTKSARITKDKEGFHLDKSQLQIIGGGSASLQGYLGQTKNEGQITLEKIPLTLLDVIHPGLGLGGYSYGQITWQQNQNTPLNGAAHITMRGLTRSGVFLSSRPIDAGIAAVLNPEKLAFRAVVKDSNQIVGQAQGEWLKDKNSTAPIATQVRKMPLRAQLRFRGASETLWRLLGIDNLDISGPIALAVDAHGNLDNPVLTGKLLMNRGRLEGTTSGTVIDHIQMQGDFGQDSLIINHFTGDTANKGHVEGMATIDFKAPQGIGLAIRLKADDALVINRDDFRATASGDINIDSQGDGGRISGDLQIRRANYQLGQTSSTTIPRLPIKEINRLEEPTIVDTPHKDWSLDLKTHARNRLNVTGMGLDSEWRAELEITGTLENPSVRGRTDLIRGNYDFAGRRFTLDRGNIRFQGEVPVEPALDITARATLNSVDATIHVTGTAFKPEINFTSTPAMPEDELLAQLLFGSSITNLSAPEALQLASALNQLRHGGANVDPINNVRKLVRLDRLRITSSSQNSQKTAVAAGKYIGRHTYVEVETDGQGYSLTSVQFQINRWLSLLSSVSTLGRSSGNIRISKDY